MALETELQFFKQHKDEWLRLYKDHFALIRGRELVGTFTSDEEAFKAGVKRFGNVSFLIKKIAEKEEIIQFPALAVGMINAHP